MRSRGGLITSKMSKSTIRKQKSCSSLSVSPLFCTCTFLGSNFHLPGTNLKLAIDYGVVASQSDLIASFLQTLIMSEGDKWVRGQASSVALALKSKGGRPVEVAQTAVKRFATKQLGKAEMIASLED